MTDPHPSKPNIEQCEGIVCVPRTDPFPSRTNNLFSIRIVFFYFSGEKVIKNIVLLVVFWVCDVGVEQRETFIRFDIERDSDENVSTAYIVCYSTMFFWFDAKQFIIWHNDENEWISSTDCHII